MASGKSEYLANALVAQLFNGGSAPAPANVFLGLFTTLPSGSGSGFMGGTEATGGNYSRLSVATDNTHWTVSNNSVSNAVELDMFTASGAVSSSAPIVGWGLWDASTSGHLLYWAPVATPAAITTSGQVPTFAIGALVVTET